MSFWSAVISNFNYKYPTLVFVLQSWLQNQFWASFPCFHSLSCRNRSADWIEPCSAGWLDLVLDSCSCGCIVWHDLWIDLFHKRHDFLLSVMFRSVLLFTFWTVWNCCYLIKFWTLIGWGACAIYHVTAVDSIIWALSSSVLSKIDWFEPKFS